jgi:hypothetical protein
VDAYTRKVNNLLNDAVFEHLRHDCPNPGEESR